MVKIICDSTADVTSELAQKYGITTVPLNIHFGNEAYRDRVDLTAEEFYKKLVESKVHPSTSAPAPGLFVEAYKKLSKETNEILVITISGGISATAESAIQAKGIVGDIVKIEVIDSLQTIGGELLLVIKAAEAAESGAKLAEITALVKDAIPRVHSYMVFDTLEYLQKGGRIGKAQAWLGGLLKFNPILTLKNGVIHPVTRAWGREQSIDALVGLIKAIPKLEGLVIEDATTPDELEILADRLSEIYPKGKMYRSRVSPAIGVHVGPHVLAALALEGK
jgi:DegV family protein with EDD domain